MNRRFAFSLLASLLVLSSCGGGSPKEDVFGGVEKLSEEPQTVTITLVAGEGSMAALETEADAPPREIVQQVLDSSISFTSIPGEGPEDGKVQMMVNLAGVDAIEMRVIGLTPYFRADVDAIASIFGIPEADIAEARSQAAATGLAFVDPLLNGDWVAIEGLKELMELAGAPAQATEEQQEQAEKFFEDLKDSTEVEEGDLEGPGDHFTATISIKEAVDKFLAFAQQMSAGVPIPPPAEGEIPEGDVTIDTWVDGDTLRQIEVDFVQFARLAGEDIPEGLDRIAIRATLTDFSGDIEAPEGAATFDIQELMGAMMGVGGGITGSDSATVPAEGFPCELLEKESQDVKDLYAEECPEYQQ